MKHIDYLRKAIALAQKNATENNGGPFGCVIVHDGKIIAEEGNAVVNQCDPTAHAEIQAIRTAGKILQQFNLEECTLYSSCEPCPMCLSAIYWSRIKHVYYAASHEDAAYGGFDDSFIYQQLSLPKQQRKVKTYQLIGDEGRAVFELWNNLSEKVPY